MEPSRHDNAKSNVRVGPPWAMWGWALTPPYSQLKDIYLFIYLFNKDWGFFLIKCITTKIPCTRHGVSLVARAVSQLFKFSEKLLNIKWNKSFINKVFFNKYIGYICITKKYIPYFTDDRSIFFFLNTLASTYARMKLKKSR